MKKDILIINPKSNVAISTLWSKKDFILEKFPEDLKKKIGIIGTTYTSYGINYIFETLAENPQIDTLILYGCDLSTSGETLFKVFGEKKTDLPTIILDKNKVSEIVKSIKLIDLRKEAREGKVERLFEEVERNYREDCQKKR